MKLHFNYQKTFHFEAAGPGRRLPSKVAILADLKPCAASESREALARVGRTVRRMMPAAAGRLQR